MDIKINRNSWLVCLFFGVLTGCDNPDDYLINLSYGVWNIAPHNVKDVEISSIFKGKRGRLLERKHVVSYPGLFPRFGSNTLMFDKKAGYIIPDEVDVSWTNSFLKDDKYLLEKSGPHKVKLRSRIPDDVLRMAAKTGYELGIGFSVGKTPVLVCWQVKRSNHPKPGKVYVRQGGDC